MNNDRLVLLGTKGGPSMRSITRMPTSSLLVINGCNCIIDCGLGVARGAVAAGLDLTEIDAVFITHLHSDHVLELGPLLHTAWTNGLMKTVRIYGPVGTRTHLDHFLESMRFDIDLRIGDEGRIDLRELIVVSEYGEGTLDYDGCRVSALRVHHPPVTECYGLRFDAEGWSITFSSDTSKFPPLVDFARDSDILVHEAMLAKGVDWVVSRAKNTSRLRQHLYASHTLPDEAAEIARDANVRHLVLHHLVPADCPVVDESDWHAAVDGIWDGEFSVGEDLMEIKRMQR